LYTVIASAHASTEDAEIVSAAASYLRAVDVAGRCKNVLRSYVERNGINRYSKILQIAHKSAQGCADTRRRELTAHLRVIYRTSGKTAFVAQIRGIPATVEFYPFADLFSVAAG
jgi:hypothetical protein